MKTLFQFLSLLILLTSSTRAAEPLQTGGTAPDFSLKTLDDQTVNLSDLTGHGKVVLIVLRGWPGYQCPICSRQVQDYISKTAQFTEMKVSVIMVYPGPAEDLKAHAKEFLENKTWPSEFKYVLDPNYEMVNAYGLRWDAPKETAYPSTFIIDEKKSVLYSKISKGHGNRTKASDILEALKKLSKD